MFTRLAVCSAVIVTSALASFEISLSAQLPNAAMCPRLLGETDFLWKSRCDANEREADEERKRTAERMSNEMAARLRETERQRALFEKQPPLPAARNRLLGRWQSTAAGGDDVAQLLALVSGCGALFGQGIVEFEAGRWAVYERGARRDLGAVSYRSGPNGGVVALPASGSDYALLPFEFQATDRVHLTSSACTLVRTNAAVPSGRTSGPAAPPSSSRAAGANPAPAVARPAPAAAPAESAFEAALWKRWRGNFGYDCPNGEPVALDRCTSDAPNADCVIVRVGQPPRNGALVTFNETRAALIKRIASCKLRPLRVVNGTLGFAP